VFVKLLLLLLWFGKELDLAHNKDIALQQTLVQIAIYFTPHNPKASQVRPKCNSLLGFDTNAISFLAPPTPHFLVGQLP
jgi:hypothetical protein